MRDSRSWKRGLDVNLSWRWVTVVGITCVHLQQFPTQQIFRLYIQTIILPAIQCFSKFLHFSRIGYSSYVIIYYILLPPLPFREMTWAGWFSCRILTTSKRQKSMPFYYQHVIHSLRGKFLAIDQRYEIFRSGRGFPS